MPRITCRCQESFDFEPPPKVDLDAEPGRAEELSKGTFLAARCPFCGFLLKPEFPVEVAWPSRGLVLRVVPASEGPEFRARAASEPREPTAVVGYAELADRVAVAAAGLEPAVVEALKYLLLRKAEEAAPDADASVWFASASAEGIEFHIHGIREGEVAVSRVPRTVYGKMLDEYRLEPTAEPYASMTVGPYLSIQNLLEPGADV